MPYTIEDIKITKKKSLEPKIQVKKSSEVLEESRPRVPTTPRMKRRVRDSWGIRKPIVAIFALAVLLGGGYVIANKFEKVTVTIQEKEQSFTVNEQFTALKTTGASVHFEVMIIPDQYTKDITLTQTQNISTKAQGTVTLYNTWSSKPVSIAAASYLSDEKGVAYKTDKAVTIPGFSGTGSASKPGTVSVPVTAFLPGDVYNGNPTNFYITAFKTNATKYKQIYGKASTPFSGGAQGVKYVASDAKSKALLDSWKNDTTYQAALLAKVEVPAGYILYPDAARFSSSIDTNILSSTPDAHVTINTTLSAVILKKDDLSNAVIKNIIPGIEDSELSEINLTDLDNLKFSFTTPNQIITKDLQILTFTLAGSLHALWQPNLDSLKSSLVGIKKDATIALFTQDPGILDARVKIFPPWISYLPQDPSKIDIKTQ